MRAFRPFRSRCRARFLSGGKPNGPAPLRGRRRARPSRPRLETLEERTVPSTIDWINRGGPLDTDGFDSVFGPRARSRGSATGNGRRPWRRGWLTISGPSASG
jgi:hypothetical protein